MTQIAARLMTAAVGGFLILVLFSCSQPQERLLKISRTSLYTVVSMTVVTRDEQKANQAIDAAFMELDRLGKLLNFYAEDSEISEINRNAGVKPVKVSADTLELVEKAVFTSEMTDGAFDATVGPVVKLWDFRSGVVPDKNAILEALTRVGFRNIVIDKNASTVYLKSPGARIDLGGIMKGYAADKASQVLEKQGIASGIVTVGGEVRAFGKKPDGSAWVIGVQNPRQTGPQDEVIAVIPVADKSLSTSGDYIKFFEKDGVRYHHLLNPQTGYPAQQCGSVTVLAKDGVTADGFAKIFVLGPEKGLNIAKKLGFDALFIDCSGKMSMTEGMRSNIRLQKR